MNINSMNRVFRSRIFRQKLSSRNYGLNNKSSDMMTSPIKDGFSRSPFDSVSSSDDTWSQIRQMQRAIRQANANGSSLKGAMLPSVREDDYEGRAKNTFTVIGRMINSFNEAFPDKLKNAGIPEDIEFEFDYDIYAEKAVVTKISDEKYRAAVEKLLAGSPGFALPFTAYASRAMNGDIASLYYKKAEIMLDSDFGQDIKDLYIDKNGKLCGMNKALQNEIDRIKAGNTVINEKNYMNRRFPSERPEELLKRLISDKNITPNISHMGYGKKGLYASDGDVKIDGNFSMNIFRNERMAMRGSAALYTDRNYDMWLVNEKKF